MPLSYEASGVRYDQLDAFKRACQKAAHETSDLLAGHGYREPATVPNDERLPDRGRGPLSRPRRGGPRHEEPGGRRACTSQTGRLLFIAIGIDTGGHDRQSTWQISMRRLPITQAMHAAVRESATFRVVRRRARARETSSLGFAAGCRTAGAAWGRARRLPCAASIAPGEPRPRRLPAARPDRSSMIAPDRGRRPGGRRRDPLPRSSGREPDTTASPSAASWRGRPAQQLILRTVLAERGELSARRCSRPRTIYVLLRPRSASSRISPSSTTRCT